MTLIQGVIKEMLGGVDPSTLTRVPTPVKEVSCSVDLNGLPPACTYGDVKDADTTKLQLMDFIEEPACKRYNLEMDAEELTPAIHAAIERAIASAETKNSTSTASRPPIS